MYMILLSQASYAMFAEIVWKIRNGLVIDAPEEPRGNDLVCWWHAYSSLVGGGLIRERSNGAYPSIIELTEEGERQAEIHFPDRSHPLK